MRIESLSCPTCGSLSHRKIEGWMDRRLVFHERHCTDCGRVWHTSLATDKAEPAPCPAPGHLDPDPPGGVVVTADREDGPVVVERIGR